MEKRVTVKGGHHCSWSMVSKDMKNRSSASGKGSGKLGPPRAWIGRRLDPGGNNYLSLYILRSAEA